MNKIIDMHCHILPGIDDGPDTMEETLAALEEAQKQNVKEMIVTPHFHPGRYTVYAPQVHRTLEEVRTQCREKKLAVVLYPGQECYYYSGLVELLNRKEVLTLAGSRYVLLEFAPDCPYSQIQFGVRDLQSNGYMPILAHFERYRCLRDTDRLLDLRQRGVWLQMNFDTLQKSDRLFWRLPWKDLARRGMVDCFGSDCHGTGFRPFKIEKAVKWLAQELSDDLLERIFTENTRKILGRV